VLIVTKIAELNEHLNHVRHKRRIGFVPTMGALHAGHLALISQSTERQYFTVCTIYVNPTQFNDQADLLRYPRTIEADIALLKESGCDLLFIPDNEEVYPPHQPIPTFDLGEIETILEGFYRPGHFKGVSQVVNRFFELVKPDFAFFGRKDYQQVMVIQKLLDVTGSSIQLQIVDTLREPDGLAMSSRNSLLEPEHRRDAHHIFRILNLASEQGRLLGIEQAKLFVKDEVSKLNGFRLEYFDIRHPQNLSLLERVKKGDVALIAVYAGRIRLIDNVIVN